ncbi:MAG TPA: hypothetical protein DER58_08790 [Firmicutes bacterium]|nr:hypothetical protein [Bacillota bacterium]
MRVWLVNQYAGVRQTGFGKELKKRGHEVLIWRSNFRIRPGDFLGKKYLLWHDTIQSGIPLRAIATCGYRRNDLKRAFNMFQFTFHFALVALFSKKPDVILGSSPHLPAAWLACMLAKLFHIPFIAEIRDLWPESLIQISNNNRSLLFKILGWMEKSLYKNSKSILALTRGIENGIRKKVTSPEKVLFLPNGVSLAEVPVTPPPDNWRRELSLDDQFVCLYAGAVGPNNALDLAVKAAKRLEKQNVSIIILGDGPAKESLVALAGDLECTNMYFIPWVERHETFTYMMNADALLLLFLDIPVAEGAIPNKLQNYLASCKPIICAGRGEAADIVNEAQGGVVIPPGNLEKLVETILWLKDNPDKCKDLSRQGRSYVEKYFNQDKLAVSFVDLVESLKENGSCNF